MRKQKAIIIGMIAGILLLWIGAIAVIISFAHPDAEIATSESFIVFSSTESSAAPQSQTSSSYQGVPAESSESGTSQQATTSTGSEGESGTISEQENASAVDSTIDPATNTSKLEPVDADPKDNGEEQVTAVYYTESTQLKGFFSLNGKWVCFYLQLDNWSSSKIVTPYDFVLVADGVSYHVSDLNQAGSDPLESTGVGQNASLQGTLIYEVPLGAEQYYLQYISDNGTITFQLN